VNSEEYFVLALLQLHDLVVEVLLFLGINGRFETPGGNNRVFWELDFSCTTPDTRRLWYVGR